MGADPAGGHGDLPADDGGFDVAIVGYGPVGQLLAVLLGRRGHRVVVVERYTDIYPMPRAVHFDHEVARILQAVDIRADTNPIIEPYDNWYEWRNADHRTLLKVDWRGVGPSWWHTSNFFAQPDLERELAGHVSRLPTVSVRRGLSAVDIDQDDTGVSLRVRAVDDGAPPRTESLRATYLVGCDGANSTVRKLLGIELTDLGFFFDWLIVDMIPNEPVSYDPPAWQLCDPARPTTIVPGGPGRRRWEFMALPGEDIQELNRVETAWRFLEPWGMTPDTAVLERHTVYTFQAQWAHGWRKGRAMIAGDAAHLMPPFAGQGMCAGMRDAFNLAWKLDAVLSGAAGDGLLDTYGPEREPHVQHFIDLSIGLGRVICVPGQEEATARDRAMIAAIEDPALAPPPPPSPRLGPGLLATGDPQAGLLSIQSRVRYAGGTGLFDDVVGRGWMVLTTVNADAALAPAGRDLLDRIGAKLLRVGPPGAAHVDVEDIDGRYLDWFADLGADTVVVRPDFYVYAATLFPVLADVLDRLERDLGAASSVTAR